MQEIGERLKSLDSHAEKAKKWQTLQQEFKELEYNLLSQQFLVQQKQIQSLDKDFSECKKERVSLDTELSELENQYRDLITQLEKADPEVSVLTSIAQIRETSKHSSAFRKLFRAGSHFPSQERLSASKSYLQTEEKNFKAFEKELKKVESDFKYAKKQATDSLDVADTSDTT